MKIKPEQRGWIYLGSLVGLIILGLAGYWFLTLPSLAQARTSFDNDRVNQKILELQQSNREQLLQQEHSLQATEQSLDPLVWTFTNEESFFQLWDQLAATNHVHIGDPQIADVTPTGKTIARSGTIVATGSLDNLFAFLNALQAERPLVAVTQAALSPGDQNGPVTLTLQIATVWQ